MGHASTVHTTILVNTRHAGAHDTSTVRYYHMQRVRVEHTAAPSQLRPPSSSGKAPSGWPSRRGTQAASPRAMVASSAACVAPPRPPRDPPSVRPAGGTQVGRRAVTAARGRGQPPPRWRRTSYRLSTCHSAGGGWNSVWGR